MDHKPKGKTIKLLEDNVGENLYDQGVLMPFVEITPKTQSMKEIINNLDFVKIQNFYSAKHSYQENEKTSHRLGENIYKRPNIYKRL